MARTGSQQGYEDVQSLFMSREILDVGSVKYGNVLELFCSNVLCCLISRRRMACQQCF